MKNANVLIIVFVVFLTLVLACGGKPAPTKYQGNWVGSDGSTLYMNSDGKAGFKIGGKSVDGGAAEFDEAAKSLKISLMGLGHTWKIDREPNDKGEMTLDGVVYRRQ